MKPGALPGCADVIDLRVPTPTNSEQQACVQSAIALVMSLTLPQRSTHVFNIAASLRQSNVCPISRFWEFITFPLCVVARAEASPGHLVRYQVGKAFSPHHGYLLN